MLVVEGRGHLLEAGPAVDFMAAAVLAEEAGGVVSLAAADFRVVAEVLVAVAQEEDGDYAFRKIHKTSASRQHRRGDP